MICHAKGRMMTEKPVNLWVKSALEFGPVLGFLAAYMIWRNDTFVIAGREYTGFVAVTAAFIPVFLAGIAGLWALTGKVSRMQIVTAVMLVLFGGLSVWLNDPRLIKMKPTAVYLLLATILTVGLLRGQSWLQYVMEDMVPMKPAGWHILTRRVIAMFVVAAAANELVWRTQSEAFWVLFESLAMPVVIAVFFMAQMGLIVDHATTPQAAKPPRQKRHGSRKASRDL
jgi:intracellular septation protein